MTWLVCFDGSDDGFAGLERLIQQFAKDGREKRTVVVTLVGWPVHVSALWDKAFARQGFVDDLHRAMAEVADAEFQRLRKLFEPIATVKTEFLEGDPVQQIEGLANKVKPDLMIVGVSRTAHAGPVGVVIHQLLRELSYPVVLTHGAT